MPRTITAHRPHLPLHPEKRREWELLAATVGAVLQRMIYQTGQEVLRLTFDGGKVCTVPIATLHGAGWMTCRRAPHRECACQPELHGTRAVCRPCGAMSGRLPQEVQRWVSAQPPHKVGDE
ncbi:hypothetical protein [Ramlibacter alkalitolerans]|uniref:Uncharacterized protein n=1 Tax=Ramlibacter alkalitolerans TaxID=2039631 RepID=A0ABS1JWM5_9BURK|nr:hypothetical protein [Ramlibacter alkalitolerans]MBL0427935.1 hypothetical protein [Ramlibacter alkalitolerans]